MRARVPIISGTGSRAWARRIWLTAGNALCWFIIAGVTAGALASWAGLERQRYLELGLWTLASRSFFRGFGRILPLAASAGLAIALAPLVVGRLRGIVESWVPRLLSLVLLAGLIGLALISRGTLHRSASERPSILLISVDSLRADHLGVYGYPRPTSPEIDRLAERGLLFRHAVAQASWTLPSMASALTGLYPSQHGAIQAERRLEPAALTLAEALRDAGYHTLAVVSHLFVSSRYGFAQGMESFEEIQLLEHDTVTSEETTRVATANLGELEEGPFFLWVHYFDPHYSYLRHPEYDFAGRSYTTRVFVEQLLGWQRALRDPRDPANVDHPRIRDAAAVYDEEIAHTDAWVGRLVNNVRFQFPETPLVVFFTSDHGEYFMERGRIGHGRDVYEELIHVPLIIAGDIPAELRGAEVERSVELASLPFTVAKLAGLGEDRFPGEDLLARDEPAASRPSFSEGTYAFGERGRKRSVTLDGWKLIHNFDDGSYELYHLASNEGESRDLWMEGEEEAGIGQRLRALLDAFSPSEGRVSVKIDLDDEERARLRTLGYAE